VRLRIGQPFGMTQRPVSRLVMSRTRMPLRVRRQQSAATWSRGGWPGATTAVLRFGFDLDRASLLRRAGPSLRL